MIKLILLAAVLFCILLNTTYAQSGDLDPSFGIHGIVKTNMGAHFDYNNTGKQVLIRPDSSIYILFNDPAFISKRRHDGSIDPAYGFNGYSKSVSFSSATAALQPDGKIVIAGSGYRTGAAVVRLSPKGIMDSSFGTNGMQSISFEPRAVAVQSDGKIVVAGGEEGFMVARYNKDGSADNTFDKNGQVITDFKFKLPPEEDGGDSVEVSSGTPNAIAIQPNGKIIVAGSAGTTPLGNFAFAIARYNVNGSADKTFNSLGRQITRVGAVDDFGYSLALQADGRIILAGYSANDDKNHFAVVRYNDNGIPDKTFNGNGKQTANVNSDLQIGNSVAIQKNGKIIVAGYTLKGAYNDFAVARFNTNGSPDKTFDKDGILTTDFASSDDYAGSVAIESDGRILVAGYSYTYSAVTTGHLAVARYNSDGSTDKSFGNAGKLAGDYAQGYTSFNAIAVQKDGKVIAAGQTWNGKNYDFAVARFNTSGSIDKTFDIDGKRLTDFAGKNDYANSIVIQQDGKIIVAGSSNNQFAIARYNADGKPDNTFHGNGKLLTSMGFFDVGESVALQSDGKIVMAGYTFTDPNFDSAYFAIARFNTNGTPDKTFSKDGKQLTDFGSHMNFANAVAIQHDGKIIAAGYSYLNNHDNFSLARYNADGSPDVSFSHDGKQHTVFGGDDYFGQSLGIQGDGKIVLTGFSESPADGNSSFALSRYTANGDRDNSFNGNGFQSTRLCPRFNFGRSVAISSDGRIALGGAFGEDNDSYAIVVYKADGTPDSSFSGDGIQTTNIGAGNSSIQSIALAGNKLYAVGYAEFPGNSGIIARYLLSQDSKAPSIKLTAPADNAVYPSHSNIDLTAVVADAGIKVNKVDFYKGPVLLHTSRLPPYTFRWTDVDEGDYILTAVATGSNGLVATSGKIHITVEANKPPLVNIISPANKATFLKGATIHLEAAARDTDGSISKVEFYNGATLLTTEYKVPYTFDWPIGKAGEYTITAKATDNRNATATSAVINISVVPNQAPVVQLISPTNGKKFTAPATGAIINFAAEAKDADGRIIQVAFYSGTKLLTIEHKAPYTYQWQNVPAGTYTLTAVAKDNWAAETTSAPITITVSTAAPLARNSLLTKDMATDNKNPGIRLSPNPATDILNIYVTGPVQDKENTLSVISSSGAVMETMQFTGFKQLLPLNVSSLPPGVYSVGFAGNDKIIYKKFVKK